MGFHALSESMPAIHRAAPFLIDWAARSLIIVSSAGIGALILRRASAAARHWVWLLGFASLLLLPVLSVVIPGWNILPRLAVRSAAPAVGFTVTPPPQPDFVVPPQRAAANDGARPSVQTESPVSASAAIAKGPAIAPAVTAAAIAAPAPAPLPAAALSPATAPLPWTFYLVLAWFLGTFVVLGQIILGYLSLWSLQRRCSVITQGTWPALLHALRRQLHISRKIHLLNTPKRTMPMTWGLLRTRIVLPEQAAGWTPEQRTSVLLHELGHVKRFDCQTQLLAQLACAVYWFNPLVWVAWHRMQVERERACDDLVLNAGAKASVYAQHLLQSAAALPTPRFVAAAVAMARPSTLEERLRAILDVRHNRRTLSRTVALGTIVLLAAALVPVAALHAQEDPAPEPSAATTPPAGGRSAASTAGRSATPLNRSGGQTLTGGRGGRGPGPGGLGGGAGGGLGAGLETARPLLSVGEGPTCPFDATIYDVRIQPSQIGGIDIDALTKAAGTTADFEKALASFGKTTPLYRVNQAVRLSSDYIRIGTNTPYITNSQITANGQTINSVTYTNTGAIFSLAGREVNPGRYDLDLSIQLSVLSEGTTAINDKITAPVFRSDAMTHKGPVQAGKPFVVVSINAAQLDNDGKAVAYIARVTMSAPQAAAP